MKNILVPTDFSDVANMAFKSAIRMAKNSDTTIHLLHSIEIMHMWADISSISDFEVEDQEGYSLVHAVTDKSNKELLALKKQAEEEGVNCVTVIEKGKPYEAVLHYVEYNNINLIVMGSKGASGIAEVIIGSNAQKIIRNAHCPILTIKDEQHEVNFDKILLASDFSEKGTVQNIKYIGRLAKYFHAKTTLLFVSTPLNFLSEDELMDKIGKVAKEANLENFTIEIHKAESAEEGIMEYSSMNNPGVVAIATHGRGFLRKLFISNTTEYLANHLDTPLLSIPHNYTGKA